MSSSNSSLAQLAKNLDVCVGFLKGLSKGEHRTEGDYIRINTANACRAVAARTGYHSEASARKAISKDVNLLYKTADKLISILGSIASKAKTNENENLEKLALSAISCLRSENYKGYNKLVKSHPTLRKLQIKGSKSINGRLIDELRGSEKADKETAKRILTKAKSPHGYRIITTKTIIEKEIENRVKRWGNTASMWWNAAKRINPKIKKNDKRSGISLPKAKTKNKKKMNGTVSISTFLGITANVTHMAESKNKKFLQKLKRHIAREEKFWSKVAGKQIAASKFIKKMVET